MERVSARESFRVWIHGSEINIIALKETSVVRKQHRSCGQFLNVVAALLKHIPLVLSIFHRVKSKLVSPHINNNNNTLFRFDYQTILQGNKCFLFFCKIFKSCVYFIFIEFLMFCRMSVGPIYFSVSGSDYSQTK